MSKQLSTLKVQEPVFTIRAKDNYSVAVLRLIQNIYNIENDVREEFETWRRMNPEVLKDPD